MKVTERYSSPICLDGVVRYLLNGCGDAAATLKTSNHRELNIVAPEGGRAEMGVLEIVYERDCKP